MYRKIGSTFFRFVTKHVCDTKTDKRTEFRQPSLTTAWSGENHHVSFIYSKVVCCRQLYLLYHDLNFAIVIGPTRVTWCAKIYNVAQLHHVARQHDLSYVSQCIYVEFLVRPLYQTDRYIFYSTVLSHGDQKVTTLFCFYKLLSPDDFLHYCIL